MADVKVSGATCRSLGVAHFNTGFIVLISCGSFTHVEIEFFEDGLYIEGYFLASDTATNSASVLLSATVCCFDTL